MIDHWERPSDVSCIKMTVLSCSIYCKFLKALVHKEIHHAKLDHFLSLLSFPVLLLFQLLSITCILDPRHLWFLTEQFQDPCQPKFPVYFPLLLQVSGVNLVNGTGFSLRIFFFRSFCDKKRSKFSLMYLAISPGILYWNFSSSVVIWNLRLDEVLTGVGDGDLLEGDESHELEKVQLHRRFWFLWCLRLEPFLQGDFDLLKYDYDDDELLLVRVRFSFFFGDLEGLCERLITSIDRWRLLHKNSAFSGRIFLSLTTVVCDYLVQTTGINFLKYLII